MSATTDLERAVIGSVLLDASVYQPFNHRIFQDHRGRILWQAITELKARTLPVDQMTVIDHLTANGKAETVPASFVVETASAVPVASNFSYYADRLRATYRAEAIGKAIRSAAEAVQAGTDPHTAHETLVLAIAEINGIADVKKADDNILSKDHLLSFPKMGNVQIPFLDYFTMPASGNVVIGAKTGSGKTTKLINLVRVYLKAGKRVVFISYELNAQDLALAIVLSFYADGCSEPIKEWNRSHDGPGVRVYNVSKVKEELPPLPADENPDFVDTFDQIRRYIADNGKPPACLAAAYDIIREAISTEQLAIIESPGDATKVQQIIETTEADAYFIDYLQIVPPPQGTSRDNYRSVQAVCDIFRHLGNRGRKLVFLAAQFNRTQGDETIKGNFDPRLEQFREAADIEQIASLAFGVGYQVKEDGRKEFFYKILKNRFAGRMVGAKIKSIGYFEYFYALRGGRWIPAEKWITPKANQARGEVQDLLYNFIVESGGITDEEGAEYFRKNGKRNYPRVKTGLLERGDIQQEGGVINAI